MGRRRSIRGKWRAWSDGEGLRLANPELLCRVRATLTSNGGINNNACRDGLGDGWAYHTQSWQYLLRL